MNIVEKIKKLNFPPDQYIVVGGAVLATHGIRNTEDLDLLVSPELFERCKQEGWNLNPWTKEGKKGKDWLEKDGVELYTELIMVEKSIVAKDLTGSDIEKIEGVPFLSLTRVAEFKKEYLRLYNRSKDVKDLSLIETYLASR